MPLYVFLHGLTVIRQQGTDLEVVLPKVPGHVQKAGGWLAETDIVNSPLKLQGVQTGPKQLQDWDGILYLPNTSLTTLGRAATLLLPAPRDVFGLLCACPTMPPYPPPPPPPAPDYVVQSKTGGLVFKRVPSVHVLVYDYSDENEVRLDNHSWEPYSNGGAISLHVISTSLEREGQAHEDATENVMRQVLQGYPGLEFKKNPRPLAAPWIDPKHEFYFFKNQVLFPEGDHMLERAGGPFAFALAELEHPTARMLRLERLGMMVRSQRSIAGLWSDPDVLGDRVCNCATTGTP